LFCGDTSMPCHGNRQFMAWKPANHLLWAVKKHAQICALSSFSSRRLRFGLWTY